MSNTKCKRNRLINHHRDTKKPSENLKIRYPVPVPAMRAAWTENVRQELLVTGSLTASSCSIMSAKGTEPVQDSTVTKMTAEQLFWETGTRSWRTFKKDSQPSSNVSLQMQEDLNRVRPEASCLERRPPCAAGSWCQWGWSAAGSSQIQTWRAWKKI